MAHTPGALLGGADVHHVPSNALPALAGSELPPQQCGRCRLLFDGDPTLHPPAQPDWWLLGGGSGHGFKHGPVMAEYVADCIEGKREPEPFHSLGAREPRAGLRTSTVES